MKSRKVLAILLILGILSGCTGNASPTVQQPAATQSQADATQAATAAQTPAQPQELAQTPEPAVDSNVPDYLNLTGFPIVNETITMTAMVNQHNTQPEWSNILVWQEYEKMTNIKIEWECVPSASITEKRNLALATDQLPDLFYRASMSEKDIAMYGAEGSFIALNDLIDQYAPNFKQAMETFHDVRAGVPMADGMIYSFPGLSNTLPVEVNPKIYINTKWLGIVGKEMPTSLDEFYDVLKAFLENDCNENGDPNDEIPFLSGGVTSYIERSVRGAFGLGNRGFSNANHDIDPVTNEMRYIPISQEYKDMLEYLHKLYSESLIGQEIFTASTSTVLAKNEQELLGSFSHTNLASTTNTNEKDFAGLEVPLKGPYDELMYTAVRGHIASKGSFLITKECKYPEAAVRWIDYFYGDEGVKLVYMGVEGVTYQQVGDNKYEFFDHIANNIPEGSSFDQVISQYVPYTGGGLPAISNEMVFKGGEMHDTAYEACYNMVPYLPKELWPPFSFTVDEINRRAQIESDLNSYIEQMKAEFIQGKTDLSQFDDYVNKVKGMDLDEYMEIYKAAYERYKSF